MDGREGGREGQRMSGYRHWEQGGEEKGRVQERVHGDSVGRASDWLRALQ